MERHLTAYCPTCRTKFTFRLPQKVRTVFWSSDIKLAYRFAIRFGAVDKDLRGKGTPKPKLLYRGGSWCVTIPSDDLGPPYSVSHVDTDTHLHPVSGHSLRMYSPPPSKPKQPARWWHWLGAYLRAGT